MFSLWEFTTYSATFFFSFLILLVTYLYFVIFQRNSRVEKCVNKFPGPPTKPLLGNALDLAGPSHNILPLFTNWWKIHGGCFRIWIANQSYIICSDAKSIEKVLTSSVHIEKGKDYKRLHTWLGTGLLTSKGAKWNSRRKLLTPAFHFKILDDFLEVFNEQAETLVQVVSDECCNGEIVNIFPYVTRCALDIICETAMGRKINAQREKDSEYVTSIYSMGELFMMRFLHPILQPDFIWNLSPYGWKEKELLRILHGFTTKVIAEKKLERKNKQNSQTEGKPETDLKDDDIFMTKKKRLAFLDLLLEVAEDGKVLSDLDIREEADTFMFEGHDTTAANLGWTMFLLASNPEAQDKVREELDGIFGSERNRDITNTDLAQMKYLELCIKESLRIFPSVPFVSRTIDKDLVMDDGLTIPAGSQASIIPYLLHRDETVFDNPLEFRPERFLSETRRHPYAYVPFSAGPRNCIGQKFAVMEEKVVLTKVILNFIMEAGESIEDIVLVPELILRPKDGIKLKLKKRPNA